MINPVIFCFENSQDPDQLASQKPADQDPHCFPDCLNLIANNLNQACQLDIYWEVVYNMNNISSMVCFVCLDALCPSQQFSGILGCSPVFLD